MFVGSDVTATTNTEEVQDIVGAMFSSNTETGITATYQDGDGTIDLVVGTLNQDTTGNAATATTIETARTIGGVTLNGQQIYQEALQDVQKLEEDIRGTYETPVSYMIG